MRGTPLLLASVSINVLAQFLIKKGAMELGAFRLIDFFDRYADILKNPYILLGGFSFAVNMILWIVILSAVDVSVAYPFHSLGYALLAIVSFLVFGEPLSMNKIIGISIICVGVFFLAK